MVRWRCAVLAFLALLLRVDCADPEELLAADPQLQEIFAALNRSKGEVRELQAASSDLRQHLFHAEEEIVNAHERIFKARRGLLRIEFKANETSAELATLDKQGVELNVIEQTQLEALGRAKKQADDVHVASEQLRDVGEKILDAGTIKLPTGFCLDAPTPGKKGSGVRVWQCLTDVPGQEWTYHYKTGQIQNRHGVCLDSRSPGEAGGEVLMWTCDPNLEGQQWLYDHHSGQIRSLHGICLGSVPPEPGAKTSAVEMQPCSHGPTQHWHYVGGTGTKKTLEALNTKIWAAIDVKSPTSVTSFERQQDRVEKELKELQGEITRETRVVMSKRLRPRVDDLRAAIRKLGDAATDGKPVFPIDGDKQLTTPPPFGVDLGLV